MQGEAYETSLSHAFFRCQDKGMLPHPALSQRERVQYKRPWIPDQVGDDGGEPQKQKRSPESRPGGYLNHDHASHAAVAFDGTSKMMDARWQRQIEFEPLAGSQGYPLLERVSLRAGFRRDQDLGLSRKGTLKPVRFAALIPHHEVHGLPCLHVNPSR